MEGNYLITTDNWFYAPDGRQYKSVFGNVKTFSDDVLGIKTNSRSSNWYIRVGNNDKFIIIAGCQIHYAIKIDSIDNNQYVKDYEIINGEVKEYSRPNNIYFI